LRDVGAVRSGCVFRVGGEEQVNEHTRDEVREMATDGYIHY